MKELQGLLLCSAKQEYHRFTCILSAPKNSTVSLRFALHGEEFNRCTTVMLLLRRTKKQTITPHHLNASLSCSAHHSFVPKGPHRFTSSPHLHICLWQHRCRRSVRLLLAQSLLCTSLPTVVHHFTFSMHTLRVYSCFARCGQYTLYHTPEVAAGKYSAVGCTSKK